MPPEISAGWLRSNAQPLTRADLADLSLADFRSPARREEGFSAPVSCLARQPRAVLAARVLGSFCPSRERVKTAARLYAPQPGSQWAGETTGGLAVVELP